MQNLTQPTLLLKPFAESGDKNSIPDVNSDPVNPQLASLTSGFPQITSLSPDNGGLPPERKDFNGLGYLTTTYDFFYQAGGTFTYNPTIATAIGGYPAGARLWYTDSDGISCILRSTINDNTNNFLTDSSVIGEPGSNKPWVIETFSGINNGFKILSFQWADHLLNDIEWLRADTFSWQDGTVYYSAYNHLIEDLDDATVETENVGGVNITYHLAKDGHKIVDVADQSAVESIYTSTGVAWYYIIDTTNQRFKLPRTKYGLTGLRDVVGKYVPESLPDHTHYMYVSNNYSGTTNNAGGNGTSNTVTQTNAVGGVYNNPAYQTSAPVQQRATQMYLYFYVGNYTQSAIEQTAGLNSEMFNEKVDVASLTECHVVVDSYVNGNSWYRKYSDGWVEQGGFVQSTGTDYESQTVNLLVEMAGLNYNVFITPYSDYNNTMQVKGYSYYNKTTTSFTVAPQSSSWTVGNSWEVKGMGA